MIATIGMAAAQEYHAVVLYYHYFVLLAVSVLVHQLQRASGVWSTLFALLEWHKHGSVAWCFGRILLLELEDASRIIVVICLALSHLAVLLTVCEFLEAEVMLGFGALQLFELN